MKLLVANWKMAPILPKAAASLAKSTATIAKAHKKHLTIVVCVPTVYLTTVTASAKTLLIGAQNVAATTAIASTGQVGATLLKGVKASYCIIGHSESRATGESNELVREKLDRLLEQKIQPILCVGERERDGQGWYLSVIKDQIESALMGLAPAALKRIVIAYEPVWAIGASAEREATPAECLEMIMFIRKLISDLADPKLARTIPILYGGSVSEDNAVAFLTEGEASGLLVGRVSLESKRFAKLASRIADL